MTAASSVTAGLKKDLKRVSSRSPTSTTETGTETGLGTQDEAVPVEVPRDWQLGKTAKERHRFMLEKQLHCDVIFSVGWEQQKIGAHRYMLISNSCVFYAMFCGSMSEALGATQQPVEVTDIEPKAFMAMLRYIYCESTDDVSIEICVPVSYAAKKYLISGLDHFVRPINKARYCMEFIRRHMDMHNVALILDQAYRFCADDALIDTCLDRVCDSTQKVFDSDAFLHIARSTLAEILDREELTVNEEQVFEAVLNWSDRHCQMEGLECNGENRRKMLGDCLFQVRFPAMSSRYFADRICPLGVLASEEMVSVFRYQLTSERKEALNCPFSSAPRRGGDKICLRFETVHKEQFWNVHGEYEDAICLSADHDIRLIALLLYGCAETDIGPLGNFNNVTASGSPGSPSSALVVPANGEVVYMPATLDGRRLPAGEDVVYQIDVKIKKGSTCICKFSREVKVRSNDLMFRANLPDGQLVMLQQGQFYSVVVRLSGKPTFRGIMGKAMVRTTDGVQFVFSKSADSGNGTDLALGQIPGFIYRV